MMPPGGLALKQLTDASYHHEWGDVDGHKTIDDNGEDGGSKKENDNPFQPSANSLDLHDIFAYVVDKDRNPPQNCRFFAGSLSRSSIFGSFPFALRIS